MKTNQIILSVRKIAEQKGISQAQIAKMLEVDRPYITKVFNLKHTPSLEMIERICTAVGCKLTITDDEIDISGIINNQINKMRKFIILMVAIMALSSCGTSKKTSVIKYYSPNENDIVICADAVQLPNNAEQIGYVNIGESGMTSRTRCTYARVVQDAINGAKAMGGTHLLIVKHKEPDWWSTCHRIKCYVYRVKE